MMIILCFLAYFGLAAEKVELPKLNKVEVLDESEVVKLAEDEKFSIPLSGRTISHHIEYIPENQGECQFIEPYIEYKTLAESQAIFDNEDYITAMLPLKKREIVFVADPFYNIASYSIDIHFLMKPRLPKTRLLKGILEKNIQPINPILLSSRNQNYIYFLTPEHSFVFQYNNVGQFKQEITLEGNPNMILKGIECRNFIILCTGTSGIMVYRINQPSMNLSLVMKVDVKDSNNYPIDMELNQDSQLLYVLNSMKDIDVYYFNPGGYLQNTKKNKILNLYDNIKLQKITYNHQKIANSFEYIGNINIEISQDKQSQSILILFSHQSKTIIAELSYQSVSKQFSFVRYFKFSMDIKEIHAINDGMVVVGHELLGIFPFGIDPSLIVEEFNGFMTLTQVERIVLTKAPFFVGVSKNQIEYGGIFLNNEAGINCHISSSSQLKQVKFKANLTVCGNMYEPQVSKYCEYEKTFIIKQMEMTASAPVATSIWVTTIILTFLIVVGLCFLFAMHKKKQQQIRKLELYFQQKRRASEVPPSSDRQHL